MRTGVVDGDVDPLRPRLMAGTFTVPTEDGVDALGLSWFERGPATRVDGGEVVATGFGTLSAGTASVLSSWLMFAGLAGVAWLVTTLDTPALIGLGVSAVTGAIGFAVKRS